MKQLIGLDAPGRSVETMEDTKNMESVFNMSRHSRGSWNPSSNGSNSAHSFRRSQKLESALDRMRDRIEINAFQGKPMTAKATTKSSGRQSPGPVSEAVDNRDESSSKLERDEASATRDRTGEAIMDQRDHSPMKTTQRKRIEANSLLESSSSSQGTQQKKKDTSTPTKSRRQSTTQSSESREVLSPDRNRRKTSLARGQSLESEMAALIKRGQVRARSSSNPRRTREAARGGIQSQSPGRRQRFESEVADGSRPPRRKNDRPLPSRGVSLSIRKDQKEVSDASSLSESGSSTSGSESNTVDDTASLSLAEDDVMQRNGREARDGRRQPSNSSPILPRQRSEKNTAILNWDSLVAAASNMVSDGLILDQERGSNRAKDPIVSESASNYVSKFLGQLLRPESRNSRTAPSPTPSRGRKTPDSHLGSKAKGSKREKSETREDKDNSSIADSRALETTLVEAVQDTCGPTSRNSRASKRKTGSLFEVTIPATRDKKRASVERGNGSINFETMEEQCGLRACGVEDALCAPNGLSERRSGAMEAEGDLESLNTFAMKENEGLCGFLSMISDGPIGQRSRKKGFGSKGAGDTPKKNRNGKGDRDGTWDGVSTLGSTLDNRLASERAHDGPVNKRRPIPVEITTKEKPRLEVKEIFNSNISPRLDGPTIPPGTETIDHVDDLRDVVEISRQQATEKNDTEPVIPFDRKDADRFVNLAVSSDSEEQKQVTDRPIQPAASLSDSLATVEVKGRAPSSPDVSSSALKTRKVTSRSQYEEPLSVLQTPGYLPKAKSLLNSLGTAEVNARQLLNPDASSPGLKNREESSQDPPAWESPVDKPRAKESGDRDPPPSERRETSEGTSAIEIVAPGNVEAIMVDRPGSFSKRASTARYPSKSFIDLNQSTSESSNSRNPSGGIARRVAKFEKWLNESRTGQKTEEPSFMIETVQTIDVSTRGPLPVTGSAGSIKRGASCEEDGELLLAVTRSEVDDLAVALSLSPTSIELIRFFPATTKTKEDQPQHDPLPSNDRQAELIITKAIDPLTSQDTEEPPAYVSHQDELIAKIRAYQERKAAKNTKEVPAKTKESPGGRSSLLIPKAGVSSTTSNALLSNSAVKGKKIAQSYIEALSKKQSSAADAYIEAVSKKQSSAGRVLAPPKPSKDGYPWLAKVLEEKKTLKSSRPSNNSLKNLLSPPIPEMRSRSVPRTRAETLAAEGCLTGDSRTSRLHAALFDDTTVSTGLISDTDEILRARHSLSIRPGESPRSASSADLVGSRMSRASSSVVSLSLGTPTHVGARNMATTGGAIANIPHSVSFNKTSRDHDSGALVDSTPIKSMNPQFEHLPLTPQQSSASSAISKGEDSSLDVGNLMSRIDHAVHRLIKSGKIDVGKAEGEDVDLHKRTLRNNTSELLQNLAILRGRRPDGGSLDRLAPSAYNDGGVIERGIQEQFEDLDATLSGLERRESALKSRKEIRARRDMIAGAVLRRTADSPASEVTTKKNQNEDSITRTRAPSPPSSKNVTVDPQAFESDNIAKLRARRDRAARMIQSQAQKLVALTKAANLDPSTSPHQPKSNSKDHQRLPRKPASQQRTEQQGGEQHTSKQFDTMAMKSELQPPLKPALKHPRFGHDQEVQRSTQLHQRSKATLKTDDDFKGPSNPLPAKENPPTQRGQRTSGGKKVGPPKPEGSGPIRPPSRNTPVTKSNPVHPGVRTSPRAVDGRLNLANPSSRAAAAPVKEADLSESSCTSLQSSARDTNHHPSHDTQRAGIASHGRVLQQEPHAISDPPGNKEPRKQSGGMSGWEQNELRKLPMLLRSATSNSNHLNLSEDYSYESSDDESDISTDDSADDSERLERIEGMIQELRQRRSRVKA